MFALNERLSEYAYGFGVTTEAQAHLRSIGAQAVPFLPNLVHENDVGFDVSFSAPGTMLMLQFKLGHQLSRFHKKNAHQTPPAVTRPFWRFEVDVDHQQFIRLRSWETLGADVYYVSPRFAEWRDYQRHFLQEAILDHSLLITPGDIHAGAGGVPGRHRVVYDRNSRFVCSEAFKTVERRGRDELTKVAARRDGTVPLEALLDRSRQVLGSTSSQGSRRQVPVRQAVAQRLRAAARTPVEGEAAIFAAEAWAEGIQVIFVGAPRQLAVIPPG